MKIEESVYIEEYKKRMIEAIQSIHPTWGEEDIDNILNDMIKKKVSNPKTELDNNYTHHHNYDASLISVFDWILKDEPIISGNGTFYKNQYQAFNPIGKMLMTWLADRKAVKKEMFKIEDTDSDEYKNLDRKQATIKINVNSYYGGSGAPSSAFYSAYSGPATTNSAQVVISTTMNMFESFVADNYNFIDLNEFFDWAHCIFSNYEDPDDFIRFISKEELFDRLSNKLIKCKDIDLTILREFIDNLTDDERKVFYYKNNLIEFIDDYPNIQDLYKKIFENVVNHEYSDFDKLKENGSLPNKVSTEKDWEKFVNKEYFMDPNSVPDSIKEYIIKLTDYFVQYVYSPYLAFDRVYRLKNFKRKVVTVIDTDSNILALDTFVNYTLDNVLTNDGNCYGRNRLHNVFITVNTITYAITEVVSKILALHAKSINIPEEFRPNLNMKNEFMFTKLVIAKTKKRYLSKVMLREGNLMKKPKIDIKGFDFVKATTSAEAESFFKMLIDKYIMGDDIDTKAILNELNQYSRKIENLIRNGDVTYLPNTTAKPLSAYKNPNSTQAVLACTAWNLLYPNKILDVPSKPKLLKLKIFSESDIESMRYKYPREYEIIKEKIFHDSTGMFITYDKKGNVKIKGLTAICIPAAEKIPECLIDYIDYSTMINNIIAPFKSVIEILGIKTQSVGKNTKSEAITNIIRF